MGWWITLGILFLLAILPLGASIRYDADGPVAVLIIGPVRYQVFPVKKKAGETKKDQKQPEKAKEKKKSTPKAADKEEKKKPASGGSWQDFIPLVWLVLDFLADFRRKLRVDCLELKLTLAGDDPADLAINYGRAWAALGNLWPNLERAFVIKKRDVEVMCDFTANETRVLARMDLTITLGRLLSMGSWHGLKILLEFFKIKNKNKGGATT